MDKIKFMDFCAGIGGGRLGLTNSGLKCVAYSEIDLNSEKTYKIFFGDKEKNYGDLTKIKAKELPEFDLLIGGFPCQTFSIVGKRAGFEDNRGMIIYSLIEIMKQRNTPYFILENVKGLVNHDKGRTLKIIKELITKNDYDLYYKVLNSFDFGVPQMRERIYFVGIKKGFSKKNFKWPKTLPPKQLNKILVDLESEFFDEKNITFQKYLNNKYNKGKFNLDKILSQDYLVLDTRQSDLRLYNNRVPTLRTGRHGILYVRNGKLHKLTGYEGLLLQGFSKKLASKSKKEEINNNKLLSQVGNAMTINVIQAICNELLECIKENMND